MNYIYRLVIIISLLIAHNPLIFSQSGFSTGASFNIGFPVGAFNDIAKTGIGGSAIAEYGFNNEFSATFSISIQSFGTKVPRFATGGSAIDLSITSIPVLLGVRYYFTPAIFLMAEGGTHFFRANADIYKVYNKQQLSTDYEAKFGAGLGGGIRYRIAYASLLEFSGVYQYVTDDLNSIALRISVMILLNNI